MFASVEASDATCRAGGVGSASLHEPIRFTPVRSRPDSSPLRRAIGGQKTDKQMTSRRFSAGEVRLNSVDGQPISRGEQVCSRLSVRGDAQRFCTCASAASMAATLARRTRSRSCSVTVRWHRRQRVRMLSKSHSPPPSLTGRIWSASHRLFRIRVRSPQCCIKAARRSPRARFSRTCSASVFTPQWAHTPRSRRRMWSRR